MTLSAPEEISKLEKKPVNEATTNPFVWDKNEDIELTKLKDYIYGDQFNLSVVQAAITEICTQMPRIRPVTSWHIPLGENNYYFDVYKMVFEKIQKPGYLEYVWPMLKVIMGDCIGNTLWAADLVVLYTLLDVTATIAVICTQKEKSDGKDCL